MFSDGRLAKTFLLLSSLIASCSKDSASSSNRAGATSDVIDIPAAELAEWESLCLPAAPEPGSNQIISTTMSVGANKDKLEKKITLQGRDSGGSAYYIGRGLASYAQCLPHSFIPNLQQAEHWIDSGCGAGQALIDYRKGSGLVQQLDYNRPRANVTGIRYETLNDSVLMSEAGVYLLQGRFLEDIPDTEIVEEHGPASIVTDLLGPLSYSADFSTILQRNILWLKPGGCLYLALHNNADERENYVYTATGVAVYLGRWVESLDALPNISVKAEQSSNANSSLITITRKNLGDISIPETRMLKMRPTNPPSRVFEQMQTGRYILSSSGDNLCLTAESTTNLSSDTPMPDCGMAALSGYEKIDNQTLRIKLSTSILINDADSSFQGAHGLLQNLFVVDTPSNQNNLNSLMQPRLRIKSVQLENQGQGSTGTRIKSMQVASYSCGNGGKYLSSSTLSFTN